jgi:tRNA(fMet)-specific endonuclease VapC
MPRYMLDTDIASYIMKQSNEPVMQKLKRIAVEDVSISVITKCELLYGIEVSPRRKQNQEAFDILLRHVAVLEYAEEAALEYARIRADLKQRGKMIGANDLFIAAHAKSIGLVLVTNNVREFERVKGLRIENWTKAN